MATKYVILKEVKAGTATAAFEEIGEQEAGNDLQAVREFLGKDSNGDKYGEGNYRGVPKRSWPDDPHAIQKKVSFG